MKPSNFELYADVRAGYLRHKGASKAHLGRGASNVHAATTCQSSRPTSKAFLHCTGSQLSHFVGKRRYTIATFARGGRWFPRWIHPTIKSRPTFQGRRRAQVNQTLPNRHHLHMMKSSIPPIQFPAVMWINQASLRDTLLDIRCLYDNIYIGFLKTKFINKVFKISYLQLKGKSCHPDLPAKNHSDPLISIYLIEGDFPISCSAAPFTIVALFAYPNHVCGSSS